MVNFQTAYPQSVRSTTSAPPIAQMLVVGSREFSSMQAMSVGTYKNVLWSLISVVTIQERKNGGSSEAINGSNVGREYVRIYENF